MLWQRTFPQGEDGTDDFLFTEKNSLASYGYNIQNSQNMDKQKIHYCFTLSDAQMEYLRCKKYKIDRMECFMSLASLAERETTLVSISKTQQVEILCGQCLVDNPRLAKLWDKDRKTVPKLLQAMEAVGISSSQKVGDNRIITLHSLSGWYVDGRFVKNGFSLKRNADGSAIIHTEVPQARVIVTTTEDDTKSDKEDGHSANGISDTDNKGNSSTADISPSLNSASYNDNRSVDKVGTNGNLSDAVTGGISHSKTTPDSLLAILFPSKKQMPNRMRESTTHIHSISLEVKHNSLTVLIPMATSLTNTITAINRHTEANKPLYIKIIPKDDLPP